MNLLTIMLERHLEMNYSDAVYNALCGKCIPYRKETKAKIQELLEHTKVLENFEPIPNLGKYLFDENLGRNKMSKFNVGDRFEIEIAEVFKGAESGNDKYRIKGFDNLVFDDKGLEKMKRARSVVKADYEVGDITYCPEDNECVVILWRDDRVANVMYSDGTLGLRMSLDRFSGIYGRAYGLKTLQNEIDAETRNIMYEAEEVNG